MRLFLFASVLVVHFASGVSADPAEKVLKLVDPQTFIERLDPAALVAGGVVMGLLGADLKSKPELLRSADMQLETGVRSADLLDRVPSSQGEERRRVQAFIPRQWVAEGNGIICARVNSNDGYYEAENAYMIEAGWTTGVATLEFKTEYPIETGELGAENVAVSVSLGKCATEPQSYAPAFWNAALGAPGGGDNGLILILNSYRASEVYLLVYNKEFTTVVDCIAIEGQPRVAFDYVCPLWPELIPPGSKTRIEVNRIRRRQADAPLTLFIDHRL